MRKKTMIGRTSFTTLFAVAALQMAACGGSSDNSPSDTPNVPAVEMRSTLPARADFGIVTEIIDLDLNDDGLKDLILFRTSDDPFYSGLYIQALVNQGNRSFADHTATYFPDLGTDWKWVDKAYLVDLNGDLALDIVAHVDEGDQGVPPLIRTPTGAFQLATDSALLDNPGAMVPIDADADGAMDILVRNTSNFGTDAQVHRWSLLLNTTSAPASLSFQPLGVVSKDDHVGVDYPAFAYAPAVLDLNNDGFNDLVYGGPKWKNDGFIDERTSLIVYLNQQDNTFLQSTNQVFGGAIPQYTHVREMVVADFTNSGFNSVLVANTGYDWSPYPGQNNALLKNAGDGMLSEDVGTSASHNYMGFTHSADAADIDQDGDIDVVYTDILGDDVVASRKVRVLANDGTGHFVVKTYMAAGNHGWTATKLVDLNNDGYPEIVLGAIDSGSDSLIIWNDGNGDF